MQSHCNCGNVAALYEYVWDVFLHTIINFVALAC